MPGSRRDQFHSQVTSSWSGPDIVDPGPKDGVEDLPGEQLVASPIPPREVASTLGVSILALHRWLPADPQRPTF